MNPLYHLNIYLVPTFTEEILLQTVKQRSKLKPCGLMQILIQQIDVR